jgi:chromosome segregation ATPase
VDACKPLATGLAERDAEIRQLKNSAATTQRMVDTSTGNVQMAQGRTEQLVVENKALEHKVTAAEAETEEAARRLASLLNKYNTLDQVYKETKALWESQAGPCGRSLGQLNLSRSDPDSGLIDSIPQRC